MTDGWIKVEDRLPRPSSRAAYRSKNVMVVFEGDTIIACALYREGLPTGWDSGIGYLARRVTHWQPLPEAPR